MKTTCPDAEACRDALAGIAPWPGYRNSDPGKQYYCTVYKAYRICRVRWHEPTPTRQEFEVALKEILCARYESGDPDALDDACESALVLIGRDTPLRPEPTPTRAELKVALKGLVDVAAFGKISEVRAAIDVAEKLLGE